MIADLDATGVLGPRSNANRHESVVPADPAMAADQVRLKPDTTAPGAGASPVVSGFSRTDESRTGPTAEDQKLARELAELERDLKKHEQDTRSAANASSPSSAACWPISTGC